MADAPNIRKVAELAGVSTATVSRALARPEKVKPETREKVLAAVAAIGFVPNDQARAFRRRASNTVILLVRDISNPFYLDVYKGVEGAAFAAGYKVLMGDARDDDRRIAHYVEAVRERHADGVILMVGRLPESLLSDPRRLPPMVIALEGIPGLTLPMVRVDNIRAARSAITHLLELRHRRIAHITGPLREVIAKDRQEGYRQTLAAAGEPIDPALVIEGDFGLAAGREAVRRLLKAETEFTALFAASDQMAVGAMGALRAHGLDVPSDVSVVGFDDILVAEVIDPPLTTVHQPRREIGRAALELLIAQIAGEIPWQGPPPLRSFPTRLVIRGSTAPAPTRRRAATPAATSRRKGV
jgi:LacI family repressor for deo operon, udp, cdd, tsx, nupC, and nupG